MGSKVIKSHQCSLDRSHAVLIKLNSELIIKAKPFLQKKVLMPNRQKRLQKQNTEDFFNQLLNAWLHLYNNNFHTPKSIEEILDQAIFLKLHT